MNHRRWSGMLPRHAGDPPPPRSLDISQSGFLSLPPCPFRSTSPSPRFSFSPSLSRSLSVLLFAPCLVLDLPTSGTHPLPCHYVVISDNERVSTNSLFSLPLPLSIVHLPPFRREQGKASLPRNLTANSTSESLTALSRS